MLQQLENMLENMTEDDKRGMIYYLVKGNTPL